MKSFTLSILPVLALVSDAFGQQTSEYGNCTTFVADDAAGYLKPYTAQRVSGGVNCPSNTNRTCPLGARGDAQVTWRNNASLTTVNFQAAPQTNPFVDSVQASLGNRTLPFAPSFNDSILGPIDNTFALKPGQSAYLNFTALLFCFTGKTDGCNSSLTVADGTPVEVCAASWSYGRDSEALLSGDWTVVNVSASEAASLRDPFENYVGSRDGSAGNVIRLSYGMLAAVFGIAAYLL